MVGSRSTNWQLQNGEAKVQHREYSQYCIDCIRRQVGTGLLGRGPLCQLHTRLTTMLYTNIITECQMELKCLTTTNFSKGNKRVAKTERVLYARTIIQVRKCTTHVIILRFLLCGSLDAVSQETQDRSNPQ